MIHGWIEKGHKLLTIFFMMLMVGVSHAGTLPQPIDDAISQASLSAVEKNVRDAAVKVHSASGHGSGSYVVMNGYHLVITAWHVLQAPVGEVFMISSPEVDAIVHGRLVWSDRKLDVAALLVPKISFRSPMEWVSYDAIPEVGGELAYSGYPSSHSLLSFRGRIAGYEMHHDHKVIIMHTHGWFGCSGSVVYDLKGRAVGVLWGIDVGTVRRRKQVVDNILWVTPSSSIDIMKIIKGICAPGMARPQSCDE